MTNEPVRVLLVDDEASFTRMMKLNLETNGPYEVRTENDAARAVRVAKEFRPDIIFLDVLMPDQDGGEVAAKIQAQPALRDTPIVFLTAVVSKDEVTKHENVIGGRTFLAKPVLLADIVREIEKVRKIRKAA